MGFCLWNECFDFLSFQPTVQCKCYHHTRVNRFPQVKEINQDEEERERRTGSCISQSQCIESSDGHETFYRWMSCQDLAKWLYGRMWSFLTNLKWWFHQISTLMSCKLRIQLEVSQKIFQSDLLLRSNRKLLFLNPIEWIFSNFFLALSRAHASLASMTWWHSST